MKSKTKIGITLFSILISLNIVFLSFNSFAANIYVDNTLQSNITNNKYSIFNRGNGGADGNAYTTIKEAITNCSVGDTIYIRGGTYIESNIDIPSSKNGTAWTTGNYTTLASYPGEWAVINGNNVNYRVIGHATGVYYDGVNETHYWKFERLEVTGGKFGFLLGVGPVWIRYCYIHDNNPTGDCSSTLYAGVYINQSSESIIEYNYFYNNGGVGSGKNCSDLAFTADYKDNTDNGGDGDAFDPDFAIIKNIVRYNLFDSSAVGVHHKNQQRFGYNNRNPNGISAYEEYGDKVHHNIFRNTESGTSILLGQDYLQVYNNIVDKAIETSQFGDQPILYNNVVYNNTSKTTGSAFISNSGRTESGSAMINYYDTVSSNAVHLHIWYYNNIVDGVTEGYNRYPFVIARDMPAGTSSAERNWSDTVIDRNFMYNIQDAQSFKLGRIYSTGCDDREDHTTVQFNSCSDGWRGLKPGTVVNYENDNSGLFQGASGAYQYKTNPNFVLSGSKTIANGGIGGPHPYLDGVAIPAYIGATNPDDDSWVDGILNDLTNIEYMKKVTGNPSWIEGSGIPAAPTGLRIVP
jgi:hypothetical protein